MDFSGILRYLEINNILSKSVKVICIIFSKDLQMGSLLGQGFYWDTLYALRDSSLLRLHDCDRIFKNAHL